MASDYEKQVISFQQMKKVQILLQFCTGYAQKQGVVAKKRAPTGALCFERGSYYTTFWTFPALRHLAQTLTVVGVPPIMVLTVMMFGLKTLFVVTPMCCPTPPFFLACPFLVTTLPDIVPFPQISHLRAIIYSTLINIFFGCSATLGSYQIIEFM